MLARAAEKKRPAFIWVSFEITRKKESKQLSRPIHHPNIKGIKPLSCEVLGCIWKYTSAPVSIQTVRTTSIGASIYLTSLLVSMDERKWSAIWAS